MKWKVITLFVLIMAILVSCSSADYGDEYGVAPNYVPLEADGSNCYAYALGLFNNRQSFSPGQFSEPYSDWLSEYTLNAVSLAVLADLRALGGSARIIKSYNAPISADEYRIALRVIIIKNPKKSDIDWDYRFMMQTSTGHWAEKLGPCSSSVLYGKEITPENAPWSACGRSEYYDSSIVYFAITPAAVSQIA